MENINSELEIVRKYGRDNCSLEVLVENFSEYDLSLTQLSQVEVNEESVKYLIDVFHELYGIFRETPRRSNLRQVFRVVDKAQYIENKFRKSLYHVIEGLEKEYEESFLQLTKFARANLWQEVSNRRNELDLIADQYNSISDEILSKPLFDHIESDSLQKYLVNMNERDDIESKYKFIEYQYCDSVWGKDSVELLEAWIKKRRLIDKIRKKPAPLSGISLPDLISEFRKIGYFEDAYKAELLKQDIKDEVYEINNPKVAEKRDEIYNQQDPGLRLIEEVVHGPAKSQEQSQLKLLDGAREDLDQLVIDTESFSTRDNFLDKNEEKRDHDSAIPYLSPMRENGKFLLPVYLSYIDANPNYQWFASMVEDGNVSWDELLAESNEKFSIGQAINQRDYDYVRHIIYGLSESRNRGEVAKKHSKNSKFRKNFDTALTSINDYLERSQTYLGLSPMEIDNHQAVFGPRNHYNRKLCVTI